jgi:hypothetical protein
MDDDGGTVGRGVVLALLVLVAGHPARGRRAVRRQRSPCWRFVPWIVAIFGTSLVVVARPARADLSSIPRATWTTDGGVDAIARGPGGVVFIAGSFDRAGPSTGNDCSES